MTEIDFTLMERLIQAMSKKCLILWKKMLLISSPRTVVYSIPIKRKEKLLVLNS